MMRLLAAAGLGALAAVGHAWAAGVAFNALARSLEMGGIPLVLGAWVYPGFLAGLVAALVADRRLYLASLAATALLFVAESLLATYYQVLIPGMTPDQRREFWSNILGLLNPAAIPLQVLFGLWGAFTVDPMLAARSARLDAFRDSLYPLAWFLSLLALLGIGLHYWPRYGAFAAALLPAAFFLWVARQNNQNLPVSDSVV